MNIREHSDISKYKEIIIQFLKNSKNSMGESINQIAIHVRNEFGNNKFNHDVFMEAGGQLMDDKEVLHKTAYAGGPGAKSLTLITYHLNENQ